MNLSRLKKELKKVADPKRAKASQRYFKTGKGEYGEGDVFLGITVPQSRKIAIKFKNLDFSSIETLLHSRIHEGRLIALLILVKKFEKESESERERIFDFYLKNTKYINNWDLVDLSAHKIIGGYLLSRGPVKSNPSVLRQGFGTAQPANAALSLEASKRSGVGIPSSFATPFVLLRLAKSKNIWERRIAVLSTFQFIKYNRFNESLIIAKILLNDKHDLIHKAVGWMLREVGKKNLYVELKFLNKHYKKMPRTMLCYSIEKFPEKLRRIYLSKQI